MKRILLFLTAIPAFAAYNQIRPVVVPHSHLTADLTNFPMAVSGVYPYLATVANGGSVTSSSGYDIIFTSDSGCITKLNFERTYWSAANGASEFHVEIPTLSHTTDTTVYLCYGNSAVTTDQQISPWDANYGTVAHLQGGSSASDSAGGLTYTANGTPAAGRGQINGASLFNNGVSADYFTSSSSTSIATAGSKTFEAWINPSAFQGSAVPTGLVTFGKTNSTIYYLNLLNDGTGTDRVPLFGITDSASAQPYVTGPVLHVGQWYHIVGVVNSATNLQMYVNGSLYATATAANAPQAGDSTDSVVIGRDAYDTVAQAFFSGAIDEVRVSNVARSAAWISAEYANQSAPNSFYTIAPPTSNSGNFSNVSIVGATNTQAIISFKYSGGSVGSCSVAVSRNSSLYPLENDVNPALFSGSNLVSRDSANLISGNTAKVVVGKRYKAYYASDGSRYSRALKQNAQYYYGVNCAGDVFSGSFSTRALAMGDTHLDGIPADSTSAGNPAWPSPVGFQRCDTTDAACSIKRRDTEYTDPQTGLLVKHLVMPDDYEIENTNIQAPLVTGSGWTIPSGWNTSTTASATITGSTNPIVLGNWTSNCCGTGFTNAISWGDVLSAPDYITPVMMQFSITANLGNAACTGTNNTADCRMDVCVTLNWQTCAPNAQVYQQPLSTTAKAYTFGSGQSYDVMQQPGKRIWAQFETGWRGGGVACDGSTTVTKVWDTGTVPPDQDPVGSYIWIQPIGTHQITANIDALHFQIDTACPNSAGVSGQGPTTGQYYIGGSAFGILVWKETSSADTLTLTNESIHTIAAKDVDPQHNSGFYGAPVQVSLGNGDPAGLVQMNQAQYSVDLLNGKSAPFMPWTPAPNTSGAMQSSSFDNAGNFWTMGSDKSLSKWVYHGDYGVPLSKQNLPNLSLWEWNLGSVLPTCGGSVTTDCFDAPTQITQAGQTLDVLLTSFDSRYSTNPFGQWYFTAVEMGKLYFEARWNGSPGQNYWGWIIIFDPQATSNVYGAYGAGCVGQNTNPAGANYLTPGCIVAARRAWDSPGTRWTIQKGPSQVLRAGWVATQESVSVFGGTGGGPAVANKVSGTANVTCPNGGGFSACIQFTVDGDPYDFFGGKTLRVLGTYAIGDLARLGVDDITYPGGPILDQPNIDLLQLVAINGTQLTFACVYGATHCPTTDVNPQMLWMYSNYPAFVYPWSPQFDWIAWNYPADPHGTNSTGNTIVWDYSTYNAHGWAGNSQLSQGGTFSPRCTASNGCYNNQNFNGTSDSQFVTNVMTQSRDNVTGLATISPTFAGISGMDNACGNNNCQVHPDYSKLGSDPVSQVGIDGRPWMGLHFLPNASDVSLVAGSLYKVANITGTLHTKIFDTQGTSGRHILRNVSGQGSVIASDSAGNYTMCQALHANECRAGSSVGDFYVNVPYLLLNIPGSAANSACYDPGGEATNNSDNWAINDLCLFDAGMEFQAYTRYSLNSFDNIGFSEQALGHLFNGGRADIFTAIHPVTNITASTYPQWYYFPAQTWDGMFATMLAEAPPISSDSRRRTTFVPFSVNVALPSGADHYGVEFGYAEYGADGQGGFECSPNRASDPCVAVSSRVSETTPFYWESETPTGATSGAIAVPALPEHVLYYRPVFFSGTTVVGRGAIQTAVIQ